MDILWDLILGIEIAIEGKDPIKLSNIINDQLFATLAACAWYDLDNDGEVVIKKAEIDYADLNNSSVVPVDVAAEYVVDRETVLLTVLETIVFQSGIRDLLATFINGLEFSKDLVVDAEIFGENNSINTNALLSKLIYGVFSEPQAIEALLINLLSWYEIKYEPARVTNVADSTLPTVNWNDIGINKDELEALPVQLDNLITSILPLVSELLPALGVNLGIDLKGDTVEAVVENLLTSLFVDTEDKAGLATTIFTALVNLFGKGKLDSILDLVYELTGGVDGGVNLKLSYFKAQNTKVAEVFAGCETWEDAFNKFYTVDAFDADVHYTEDEDGNKTYYLNNGTNLLATQQVEDGVDAEGNKVYKTVPVIELAKDAEGNLIPAMDGSTVETDAYGSLYYTEKAVGEDDILKDGEGNIVYVAAVVDGKPVYAEQYSLKIKNTNSFGVTNYAGVLALLESIIVPFVPVLKLLLLEGENLVILDGVSITSGDGYDRFVIPVAEMLGIKIENDKDDIKTLTDAQFAAFVIDGVEKLLNTILAAPVQFIVDLIPSLSYFISSGSLAQAVEQFLAPVLTIVDMLNAVTAEHYDFVVDDKTTADFQILNVYEFLAGLLTGLGINLEGVTDVKGIVDALLTEDGLISLINGLVKDKDLSFLEGIFTEITAKTAAIGNVETARFFGAQASGGKRYVKGVTSNRANTLVQVISELVLSKDGLIFPDIVLTGNLFLCLINTCKSESPISLRILSYRFLVHQHWLSSL